MKPIYKILLGGTLLDIKHEPFKKKVSVIATNGNIEYNILIDKQHLHEYKTLNPVPANCVKFGFIIVQKVLFKDDFKGIQNGI